MSTGPRILTVGDEPAPLRPASSTAKPRRKGANNATGSRFQVLNTFADCTLAGLSRAEMAVWLLLWRDTKPDGLARTSQVDLARRAGTNNRTARRALESLRRRGLLTVVYRGGLRRGVSKYRVLPLPSATQEGVGDLL